MATVVKDLGAVTAYAYAVAGGYSGTEAEFEALLGNIAEDLSEIENLSVTVTTIPAGSSATASYSNGVLSLGIPKGDKGDKGDTGATGATGPTGNGISTITKTGTSGLVDTYTITFTNGDTTTFTVTNGEDGEVTTAQMNAAIETALEDYAKVDGSYSSLTAGNAEQLVSTVGVTDKTPYLFRTTGGSADVGDRVKMSEITGGTVAWNQIAKALVEGNYSKGAATAVYDNGTVSFTAASRYGALYGITLAPLVVAHKYLINADIRLTNAATTNSVRIAIGSTGYNQGSVYVPATTPTNVFTNVSGVVAYNPGENPTYNNVFLQDNRAEVSQIDMKNLMLIDLTAMFGSTIADYIYSLEQNTAGAGVAWFRKLFPKDYYSYDAGSLLSVKTTAHKEIGFNQWDEEWEAGTIDSIGVPIASTNTIRSKNFCKVIGGATYYARTSKTDGGNQNKYYLSMVFYDADKNYISKVASNNLTFTAPANAVYFKLHTNTSTVIYGNTYNHDICINLHWDGERDGEYEPYVEYNYPLDSDLELRGIPKLDANNNLYYDGDGYAPDGTVTRRYAEKTFDNETNTFAGSWGVTTNGYAAYITLTDIFGNNPRSKCVCDKFVYSALGSQTMPLGTFGGSSGATTTLTFILPSSVTTLAQAKEWLASNPFTITYPIAPTTESADPYQETQVCNDFGTEEFVDSRTVPMPVGANALYQANLRAKLEMAPDSPSGDGDYIVRQTDGLNEYVAVSNNSTISGLSTRCPDCPTDTDGTFVLKATVSSGTVTYAWTAE